MIEELLERLETELDELSNSQLNSLIDEFEHMPLLGGIVESLGEPDDIDEDEDDDEEEELPLIDGDWNKNLDDEDDDETE